MRKAKTIFSIALALTAIVCHTAAGAGSNAVRGHADGDAAALPDFDGDGTVGFGDFVIFAGVFGASQGDEKWEAGFDLDGDGGIGFSDFVIFAQHFGEAVSYDDRAALVAFYHATDGPNWDNNENWLTEAPLDEWFGVETNREGRVVELALSYWDPQTERWISNGASGQIPSELGELTSLEYVQFFNNRLSGPIPPELGKLKNLRILDFASNNLSGPIPPELGSLASLEWLSLAHNDLTGPIPESFLALNGLERFRFEGNADLCVPGTSSFLAWLRGIEDRGDESEGGFCNESNVAVLASLYRATGGADWTNSEGWLGDGAVEEWHGVSADSLGRVTALDLTRNGLTGRISRRLGEMVQLTELKIAGNPRLSGRLPLSLTALNLRTLHYSGTGLCAPGDASFRDLLGALRSHEGTGTECAPLSDREILTILYEFTDGSNWNNNENWLTDAPLVEWYGVEVDASGRVVGLEFWKNGLAGRLPPEIGGLASLRKLNLRWDRGLSGPIPPEIGNLAKLEWLGLEGDIGGTIPPELGNLANLRGLVLRENNLNGSVPPELGGLRRLVSLDLEANRLTGRIPPELGRLANMEVLNLNGNSLTGTLPPELGTLASLTKLFLGGNNLTGPVPSPFGGLVSLREIILSRNPSLSGPLPISMTDIASLQTLQAGSTALCMPSDARFVAWLEAIPDRRVAPCEGGLGAAYVTQSIQSRVFPVPLVAGEKALLRVFPTAERGNAERIPRVRASFHVGTELVYVADIRSKPGPIPTVVDEGSLAASANAVIPAEAVRVGLEMVVEVDPERTLDPRLGVAKRIPETGRMAVDVGVMHLLDLTVIPFLWTTDPDSVILEQTAGMAADPGGHELLEPTRVILPVRDLRVTAHEPVLSSSNNGYDIIKQTKALRAMEGGTGYWMGMMSGDVTGGVAGLSSGAALYSVDNAVVIAHELGHSFSLAHATSPGATGVDPAYPYADASIGVFGYDFRDGGRVVAPAPIRRESSDVMHHQTGGDWISDYHFSKALNYRLTAEGMAPLTFTSSPALSRSLLLWGGIDGEGNPYLEPAFVVDAPPALPESPGDHGVTGRSAGGDELFFLSFDIPVTACGDGSSSFAFVLTVRSEWEGDLASITVTGPGGSDTLNGETVRPLAILRNPRNGQVRGFLRGPARSVAAESALNAASKVPGTPLEVLFSRGIPDAAAWRR